MKFVGPAGITLQLVAMALALGAVLFGCGGGAEEPPPQRRSGQGKNLIECASLPDVESFSIQDATSGKDLASGGATSNPSLQVSITLRDALATGCVVRVLRNGAPLPGGLTECARSCTFNDRPAGDGTYAYTVRTEGGGSADQVGFAFGVETSAYPISLDRSAPTQRADVTLISDDGNQVNPVETGDTTPSVGGTVSAALGTGESVRLLRDGAEVALLTVTPALKWTYQEATPLPSRTEPYAYQAQVVDAAGNRSALGSGSVVIVREGAVSIPTKIENLKANGLPPLAGAVKINNNPKPELTGTIDQDLTGAQVLRVYRNGVPVGVASLLAPRTWKYATSDPLADGSYQFRLRVESSAGIFGESAEIGVPIDTTAPKAPVILGFANNRPFQFQAGIPSLFNPAGQSTEEIKFGAGAAVTDADPRLVVEYSIAKDEELTIKRDGVPIMSTITAQGTSSLSIRVPAAVNRPPTAPTSIQKTLTYTAEQKDAAGNIASTTFAFTVAISSCNRARALSSTTALSAHDAWGGTSTCAACHTVSGQYVGIVPKKGTVAESNYLGESSWYWCSKI